ncbi:GHMP kinase [Fischerella thermalis CCMEE 5273]|nr:GHMP kinase [Fischerella thermalis CCMEE 5273]
MIISQTPLRVSFFGGGTDIKDYYEKYGGICTSVTIDKYVYVIIKARYDNRIVVHYSQREEVTHVNDIQHPIVREALKMTGLTQGLEIISTTDIPMGGSGLGSSSSFTVGLLNALFTYQGNTKNPSELAELACQIEIEKLGEPIGKQDQYAAAFGGFKEYSFCKDGTVHVKSLDLSPESYRLLGNNTLMFYTGITRKASSVLSDQKENMSKRLEQLHTLKRIAQKGSEYFTQLNIQQLGKLLNENWENKRRLSDKIHNDQINHIYELGRKSGSIGGKLLGAGGGGFFLFICQPDRQQDLRTALKGYKELPIEFERMGSRIILNVQDSCVFLDNGHLQMTAV